MLTAKHSVYAPDRYRTSCWTDKEEHPNPRNTQKTSANEYARMSNTEFIFEQFFFPPAIFWTFLVSIVQKDSGALTKIALKCQKEAKAKADRVWLEST